MNKLYAIIPTTLSLFLVVPASKLVLAEPITVPNSLNLAQATIDLSNLTGQYLVQGQAADGDYTGVAWIQANANGDKIEVHWSVDNPSIPGLESYVGVGGINSEGNLEVTYVGSTTYEVGVQTFMMMPDGTLQADFEYTAPDGQPATGSETLIPVSSVSLP